MAPQKKTVLAFGSFDFLHPGHISYLTGARALGDSLVVVVGRDATIERFKGKKPYFNEQERVLLVSNLSVVDKAVLGDIKDPYKVIRLIKPAIICLGYDQKLFVDGLKDFLKKNNFKTRVVTLSAHKPKKYKSTALKLSLNV